MSTVAIALSAFDDRNQPSQHSILRGLSQTSLWNSCSIGNGRSTLCLSEWVVSYLENDQQQKQQQRRRRVLCRFGRMPDARQKQRVLFCTDLFQHKRQETSLHTRPDPNLAKGNRHGMYSRGRGEDSIAQHHSIGCCFVYEPRRDNSFPNVFNHGLSITHAQKLSQPIPWKNKLVLLTTVAKTTP